MGLNAKCFQILLGMMCLVMGTISVCRLDGKIFMTLCCAMQKHEYQFTDENLYWHLLERQQAPCKVGCW